MVKVIIKYNGNHRHPGKVLGEINAGVILRTEGGMFLSITDKALAEDIEKVLIAHKIRNEVKENDTIPF